MPMILNGDDNDNLLQANSPDPFQIEGFGGNDSLVGGVFNDTLNGGSGDDFLTAKFADDILNGGSGNDILYDNTGGVVNMNGGSGADTLQVSNTTNLSANSTLDGGADLDWLMYMGNQGVTINLGAQTLTMGSVTVSFSNIESISGGTGNDTLVGTSLRHSYLLGDAGDDQLNVAGGGFADGGTGNDTLSGAHPDDTLMGGEGNDYLDARVAMNLFGGEGDDHLYGGTSNGMSLLGEAGSDYLEGDVADEILNGGKGADTLLGAAGNDTLYAGTGSGAGLDSLTAGNGNDVLYGGTSVRVVEMRGGDGDDVLDPGSVRHLADVYDGGRGRDTISFAGTTEAVQFRLDASTFTIGGDTLSFISIENAAGGTGSDSLQGSTGNNVLDGNGGNDTFSGGGGTDTLYGDNGNDLFVMTTGSAVANGGEGNDTFRLTDTALIGGTIKGQGGTDVIQLTVVQVLGTPVWTVDLLAGTVTRGGLSMSVAGVEWVWGSDDRDTLTGDDNANQLMGAGGNDFLNGNAGADTMAGEGGADTIYGGQGNDSITIRIDGQTDQIDGGLGEDTLTLVSDIGWTLASDGTAMASFNPTAFSMTEIEVLVASSGDDNLSEAAGLDRIYAGFGNDTVSDNGSNSLTDFFDGGDGIDELDLGAATGGRNLDMTSGVYVGNAGATGFERIIGGAFGDTIGGYLTNDTLIGDAGNDSLFGYAGDDRLVGDAGDDTMSGAEGNDTEYGYAGNDSLLGGLQTDYLFGGTGNDTIDGEDGNDNIFGDADADLMFGGEGIDTLNGGAGVDRLSGGGGADSLIGGAGVDIFAWLLESDSGVGELADTIADFVSGVDKLYLQAVGGTAFIGSGGFNHVAGEVRADASASVTLVSVDLDGDADADMEILLAGQVMLQVSDFVF